MIEKLFTSRNRVKILEKLLFQERETYIRRLSRELKISSSAVKREIDNLVLIGLVKKTNNKIEINDKCSFVSDLKNIFIKTDFIVYPIKSALMDKDIKFALIFGSIAKGNFSKESDVDLLIVGNTTLSKVYNFLKPIENQIKKEINPVVWTIENLKKQKNSGFVRDIFKKNIIMMKGDENEIRKIIR